MNILVLYHTLTGNTEKIARAIYEKAGESGSSDIYKIDQVNPAALKKINILFVGSPCHAGDLAIPVKEFLESLPESRHLKMAGFVTHAAPVYETRDFEKCRRSLEELCGKKSIEFLDFFDCQGFLTQDLHTMIKKARALSEEEWEEMVQAMNGHPDEEDEKRAGEFASRIIRSVAQG